MVCGDFSLAFSQFKSVVHTDDLDAVSSAYNNLPADLRRVVVYSAAFEYFTESHHPDHAVLGFLAAKAGLRLTVNGGLLRLK